MKQFAQMSLPLGTSDFSVLRGTNEIYIDKTALIYELAGFGRGKILLSRPRRFGKSLLVSTFESLFKHGLRDFKGLAIESLWNDKTYDVVHLDFSLLKDFQSIESFLTLFDQMLNRVSYESGLDMGPSSTDPIDRFTTFLSRQSASSLVLLIDEYDAPLTAHLNAPELFDLVRMYLSRFYSAIKSYEGCLRFFFMTGITKINRTEIFNNFNIIQDITLDPMYGTLLGFTEEEILNSFGAYLERAQSALGLTRTELLDQLRDNYDGFSFDELTQTHVYCPWSVLNFLDNPWDGFQNYWFESGGQPTVLMKYLANHSLEDPSFYVAPKQIHISELSASQQYDDVSAYALLTQAGYLTIKSVKSNKIAILGYPNREVSSSMAQLYANELLKGQLLDAPNEPTLSEVLASGSAEEVIARFNRVLNAIDYQRYPIKDEASCRAHLQMYLLGADMMPKVENHTALGRSDMEVEAGNRHWVFEFKFAETDDDADRLLAEAFEQVQSRRYGETPHGKELLRVALVFSAQQRKFAVWEFAPFSSPQA